MAVSRQTVNDAGGATYGRRGDEVCAGEQLRNADELAEIDAALLRLGEGADGVRRLQTAAAAAQSDRIARSERSTGSLSANLDFVQARDSVPISGGQPVQVTFEGGALTWLMAIKLISAIVLALPTAWDREVHSRIMGLRTFPLVSVGACSYVLIGMEFVGIDNAEGMARVLQGLMTGVGFIGGGAILKNDDRVKGTTSASSIWITGAVGAAVGFGDFGLAALLAALNFAVLILFGQIQRSIENKG